MWSHSSLIMYALNLEEEVRHIFLPETQNNVVRSVPDAYISGIAAKSLFNLTHRLQFFTFLTQFKSKKLGLTTYCYHVTYEFQS